MLFFVYSYQIVEHRMTFNTDHTILHLHQSEQVSAMPCESESSPDDQITAVDTLTAHHQTSHPPLSRKGSRPTAFALSQRLRTLYELTHILRLSVSMLPSGLSPRKHGFAFSGVQSLLSFRRYFSWKSCFDRIHYGTPPCQHHHPHFYDCTDDLF